MPPGFTSVFSGNNIAPALPTYSPLQLSSNIVLGWPTELTAAGAPVLSEILDVTATLANLSVSLSDATQSSTGYCALFNNVGVNTFTVKDSQGNALMAVPSGQVWQIYLADNTTPAGVWRIFQFGAGVSAANAAALAGAGLKAIATTLNEQIVINAQSANYAILNGDRASCLEWTGGSGGVFSLPNPAAVGPAWFCYVQNSGTGTFNLTPSSGTINGADSQIFQPLDSAIIATDGVNFITIGLGRAVASTFNFVQISLAGATGVVPLAGPNLNRISYRFTGALAGDTIIQVPGSIQQYWVDNSTTGPFSLTFSSAGGGATVAVSQGFREILYCDGTNVVNAVTIPAVAAGGANTQVQFNDAGAFNGSSMTYQKASGVFSIPAPTAGNTPLSIVGSPGASILTLTSGNTSTTSQSDLLITRDGSTSNQVGQGASIGLVDTSIADASSVIQQAGGQTEVWQFNGDWHQLAKWTVAGALILNPAFGGGVTLTVDGVPNSAASVINSGTLAGAPAPDLQVSRQGSLINQVQGGPNIALFDSVNTTETVLQNSGGQTELWQFNGAWGQLAFWGVTGNLTLNAPSAGRALLVNSISGLGIANLTANPVSDSSIQATVSGTASIAMGVNLTAITNPFGALSGMGYLSMQQAIDLGIITGSLVRLKIGAGGNLVVNAPTVAATALAVNGAANAVVASLFSGNAPGTAIQDLFISRAGSNINQVQQGPNLSLFDSTANTSTALQNSGGQTELWQFNAGSWRQVVKVTVADVVVLPGPAAGNTLQLNSAGGNASAAINILGGGGGASAAIFASWTGAVLGWGGGSQNTGAAVPTLTANKPGANSGIIAWVQVSANGTTGWMPVWGN